MPVAPCVHGASRPRARRWGRGVTASAVGACTALLVGAAVAGCGTSAVAHNHVPGDRLTIYASVPFDGPSSVNARAVLGGAQLALDTADGHVGAYGIKLRVLNDATIQSRGWDPGQTSANARRAAADPSTIGYIGELNSGASAISIPLLNRAGIPQVSPSSTAVGLTMGGPEANPGEPEKYYPTESRTFVRVVPNDSAQAAVQARLQHQAGCRATVVLDDGEVDGRDGAISFAVAAHDAGVPVVATDQFSPSATNYRSLAASVARTDADCVLISALPQNHATLLTKQVARALPESRIFGWAGLAESTYTDPDYGGIPEWLDPRMTITVATLAPRDYPRAGRRFFAAYTRRYGHPQPYAIYGYEAMSLMLSAIARATHEGSDRAVRSRVRAMLFATRDRHSVLGTYSLDSRGDTSLDRYGVYHVVEGRMVFWKAMTP